MKPSTGATTAGIGTPRLLLRPWRDSDRAPFAALNADPEVMRFFPAPQSREASDRAIDTWQAQLATRGWSNWAVEVKATGQFIGFIGLSVPIRASLPFMPCVELGYRLCRASWGHGYATEGAKAALAFGFDNAGLDEIVSFTSLLNLPSQAVMRRVGMTNTGQDFDYPTIPEGNPLRRHCLYKLARGGAMLSRR